MIDRNIHLVSARKHDAITYPVMEAYLKILAALASWRFSFLALLNPTGVENWSAL